MHSKIFIFFVLGFLSACAPEEPVVQTLSGKAFGTAFHISYWLDTPVDEAEIQHAVEETLDTIDKNLSNIHEDSTLTLFNAKETNDSLLVGKDIVELVRLGKNVNQLSQGCFDLTVRPLSAMWGFDTDTFTIPTPEIIEQALSKVGMDKLEIVDDSHIKKLHAESKLDTSLLQKGLSVAKISEVLERIGISNYRIDLGGQLKTNGHLPNGGSWLVAIDRPLPGERHLHKVISMPKEVSMSVMTASAHRYFFDTYGQRYANVLDVRTGKPVSHNLLAVMVLHENPVLAEAWASALLCLGPQISMSLANSENLNVFFVKQQGSELLETQTVTLRDSTNISIQ